MSYRDAPNPGPLYGYPILPALDPGARLTVPRNDPAWYSSTPAYDGAQSVYPSDLPAPLYVAPELLAGDAARISSPYGMRTHPTQHVRKMHSGIDIAVPVGTPVYPVGPAVVVAVRVGVDPSNGGPAIVKLRTADGYTWGYMHLSAVLVPEGMSVGPGQPVGLSGTAGTGPHLHFVAWAPDGQKVDPVTLFPPGTFRA